MKRIGLIFFTLFYLVVMLSIQASSATSIVMPTEVKVGIAFDDPYKYSALIPVVKIKATDGINVMQNNKLIYTFTSGVALKIIKTTDLMKEITVKTANAVATVSPIDSPVPTITPMPAAGGYNIIQSSKAIPLGGKYHIRINHIFSSYTLAKSYVSALSKLGIYSFPLFTNSNWYICIGGYTSDSNAKAAITELNNENNWIGSDVLTVFNPDISTIKNKTGLAITKDDGKLYFMAYTDAVKLEFKAKNSEKLVNIYLDSLKTYREYRGKLQIFRNSEQSFSVVNVVNFEEYLWGVVPAEMSGSSPLEALKAQAVASRTYAYNQIKPTSRHGSNGFDICASVHCHVYKGKTVEYSNSTKAINDTTSQIVRYQDNSAKVFYYSSNGGSTENVKYVWGSTIPYLISVKDSYETPGSNNYTWKIEFTDTQLDSKLSGYNLGAINNIRIVDRTPSGRPFHVQVIGTKGVKNIYNESCRTFIGLPSQQYNVTTNADIKVLGENGKITTQRLTGMNVISKNGTSIFDFSSETVKIVGGNSVEQVPLRPTKYTFEGKGWGHAIGMSQNGAVGAAKKGLDYKAILGHYFPGTSVN